MNSVDELNGVTVIDSGIQSNLVQNGDTSLDTSGLELLHRVRDVGSSDDVLLELDGGLNDVGVESVENEGDDEIVGGDGGVEGRFIGDVDGDSVGVSREGGSEGLSGRERSTS